MKLASSIRTLFTGAVLLGTAVLAVPSTAEARSQGAAAGRPADAGLMNNGCLGVYAGTVCNHCGTTVTWEIFAMPVDNAGWHGGTSFGAYGASASNNVGCHTVGMTETYGGFNDSGYNYLPSFGSDVAVGISGSSYVWSGGNMYMECTIMAEGCLDGIAWNP